MREEFGTMERLKGCVKRTGDGAGGVVSIWTESMGNGGAQP